MARPCDCLGRTCLQWGADGELTAVDFRLVMERLAQVDPEVTALAGSWPQGFHQGLRGGASWLPSQRG